MMMLCLEAQVPFYHHDYLAVLEEAMLSDAVDVTLYERELLLGLLSAYTRREYMSWYSTLHIKGYLSLCVRRKMLCRHMNACEHTYTIKNSAFSAYYEAMLPAPHESHLSTELHKHEDCGSRFILVESSECEDWVNVRTPIPIWGDIHPPLR